VAGEFTAFLSRNSNLNMIRVVDFLITKQQAHFFALELIYGDSYSFAHVQDGSKT
jgi:hypothetical protein